MKERAVDIDELVKAKERRDNEAKKKEAESLVEALSNPEPAKDHD